MVRLIAAPQCGDQRVESKTQASKNVDRVESMSQLESLDQVEKQPVKRTNRTPLHHIKLATKCVAWGLADRPIAEKDRLFETRKMFCLAGRKRSVCQHTPQL